MTTQLDSNFNSKRKLIQTIVFSVVLNGVVPFVIYSILSGKMSEVAALSIAAIVPALDNLVSLARHRKLDVFGSFMLAGLVVGVGVVFFGGDPKLILIRESFVTAAFGLVMLGSLLLPRPIIFYFAVHFSADEAAKTELLEGWTHPYFRFVMYFLTTVWGVSLVAEAIVRTLLVFVIDNTSEFLAVSPFVQYGMLGATIAWTVWYANRSRKKGLAMRRELEQAQIQAENQLVA